jgi:hypothetical protein
VAREDFLHQTVDVSIDEQAQVLSGDLVVVRLGIDAIAPADNLVGSAEDGTQSHAGRKGRRPTPATRRLADSVSVRATNANFATECSKDLTRSTRLRDPKSC